MEKRDSFTIALIQQACSGDREQNLGRAIEAIRQAASEGAEIVCLQELFLSRYFCTVESSELFELAEPIPGPTTKALSELCRELEIVLIVPIFERRSAGVYHNSAVVIDADGSLVGVYRKMHIPDDPLYYEKFYFTPGDALGHGKGFQVFETRYATVGVLICWDQWYPEASRITSLMGAEVLFFPTAIGWHPSEKKEHGEDQLNAWRTVQQAHAIANGVYVGTANRVGHEPTLGTDGIEFFGNSFVCDPFGKLVSQASSSDEAVLLSSCDRRYIEQVRRNWPFFRDRRVDAYGPVSTRLLDGKSE